MAAAIGLLQYIKRCLLLTLFTDQPLSIEIVPYARKLPVGRLKIHQDPRSPTAFRSREPCQVMVKSDPVTVMGSQTYLPSIAFFGRHWSAMKMNAPGLPCTGSTNVLCAPNVRSALGRGTDCPAQARIPSESQQPRRTPDSAPSPLTTVAEALEHKSTS